MKDKKPRKIRESIKKNLFRDLDAYDGNDLQFEMSVNTLKKYIGMYNRERNDCFRLIDGYVVKHWTDLIKKRTLTDSEFNRMRDDLVMKLFSLRPDDVMVYDRSYLDRMKFMVELDPDNDLIE